MSHTIIRIMVVNTILVLSASGVFADTLKPYTFKCDDGRKFTITFVKEKGDEYPSKAKLVFSKRKTAEVLENQRSGSGISYGNAKYNYNEHQGDVSLTDYTKPKKGNTVYETPCHEVK